MDGSEPTSEAQSAIYEGGNPLGIVLFGKEDRIKEYFSLKEREKKLKTEMEQIKQELQEELGDYEVGSADGYTVTWKTQSRSSFDAKRFAADHPDMDLSEYYKHSDFRVFKIKEA